MVLPQPDDCASVAAGPPLAGHSYADFAARKRTWGNFIAERAVASEGYGLIRVDRRARTAVLECWPWNESTPGGSQFPGWPYTHRFDA